MKDITKEQAALFQVDSTSTDKALKQIDVALDFLWSDKTKSIHDKVAGTFDYEELLGALLTAQAALRGAVAIRHDFEKAD